MVNIGLVREALHEIADEDLQKRLWSGEIAGSQSSFVEAVESLFDDSGLDSALRSGTPVFSDSIDRDLIDLASALAEVLSDSDLDNLLSDGRFGEARSLAKRVSSEIEAALEHHPDRAD